MRHPQRRHGQSGGDSRRSLFRCICGLSIQFCCHTVRILTPHGRLHRNKMTLAAERLKSWRRSCARRFALSKTTRCKPQSKIEHDSPCRTLSMEPLSIAASAVALATVASQLVKALVRLRDAVRSDHVVLALANEVSDVELVLRRLGRVLRSVPEKSNPEYDDLFRSTECIRERLEEANSFIRQRLDAKDLIERVKLEKIWHRETSPLKKVQHELCSIRRSISLQLESIAV
jgi:hypothetical protein